MNRAVPMLVGAVLLLSGCSAGMGMGAVSPAEIPELERVVSDDPTDANAWARLGVAYGAANQPYEARQALERSAELPGTPVAAWAHLGTWREEAGDLDGAAEAYRRYLDEGGGRATESVEARLTVVERQLLARQARDAMARESQITAEDADPATVGVMPLLVEGPERFQPLGTGLAELLTTDLSITDRLNVLERAQLSALMTETRLALGGYTDAESASRVGRLLRAGRLVQGQIAITEAGDQAEVTALVVNAQAGEATGEATEAGALEQLMELEVQLALQIYRQLGIELTDAERARLEEKPTRNLQAFLAYSEGLQLLDAGSYDAASARFQNAASIDPGFNAAQQAAQRTQRAARTQTSQVSQQAGSELAAATDASPDGTTLASSSLENFVDATVPAGVGATSTGSGTSSTSTETSTVENTETTAGTGTGQVVRIPIVLTRPRPFILLWRLP